MLQPSSTPAVFKDDLTGQVLDGKLVMEARREELDYFGMKGVWVKRKIDEAMQRTGKRPITVRWVDVNKGDDECPEYRSRLVAREIRRKGEAPIFAPTPPLEGLRLIISLAASDIAGQPAHVRDPRSPMRTQVSFVDLRRAYFCASCDPETLHT